MSWVSDAWDSIAGAGGSAASTGTDKTWLGGFLGEIFSPKNVAGGLATVGASWLQGGKGDDAIALQTLKGQQEAELAAQQFEREKALLQLKASLDGGGGGSGASTALQSIREQIAYNKLRDQYQGKLQAREAQIAAATKGSQLSLDAIRTIIQAGQAPIV